MTGVPKQAIVMAAGEAKRLRPLTQRRSKGMLLVGGQPILLHLLSALKAVGVERVVLVVGHASEGIQTFFKDGRDFGLRVEYVHQSNATGTADAARLGLPLIDRNAPCLILPGDNYLNQATLQPLREGDDNLLLLAAPTRTTNYGIPTLKGNRLRKLHDGLVSPGSGRISTGILRADQALLTHLADDAFRHVHDLDVMIQSFLEADGAVRVAPVDGPWKDVTEPWDVLQLNEHILRDLPADQRISVGRNTTIAPSARIVEPVHIGEGCTIGEFTVVGPYVSIRNNTTIGSHCEIRRSILNNNVTVDSRCLVRGSVVDDGVRLGTGFVSHEASTVQGMVGCVLGADAEVGHDVRAESGAIVDSEAKVETGTRIAPARVPSRSAVEAPAVVRSN